MDLIYSKQYKDYNTMKQETKKERYYISTGKCLEHQDIEPDEECEICKLINKIYKPLNPNSLTGY